MGRCQIGDALAIAQMVVVADEVSDLLFKVVRQIMVCEQDAVLEGLVPTFNFPLCMGMHGRTTQLIYALAG